MADFEITYSHGPRYIDGVNIDADFNGALVSSEIEIAIDEPVQEIAGRGYEPGQKNKDGSLL
jgi:hypothetical protein